MEKTEQNRVVQGVRESGCQELTFTPETSGMKGDSKTQVMGGVCVCVCVYEGEILGRECQVRWSG